MTGVDIALDTSAVIQLLNNERRAAHFLASVGDVYIPAIAIGELLFGALNSGNPKINLPKYRSFLRNCRLIPVDDRVAEAYARTRLALKKLGKPIPDADLWIAASAIIASLPLATADRHFDSLPDLQRFQYDWSQSV